MGLEQKINVTFLNRIRKSLTEKLVVYGLATSLAFWGLSLTSCGETANSKTNYIYSTEEPTSNCEPKNIYYMDNDGDGYGNSSTNNKLACFLPKGYVINNLDCNDNNSNINTNIAEVCNGIDDNCDGQIDEGLPQNFYCRDADGDGYGNPTNNKLSCPQPAGYVIDCTDSNDSNSNIN